METETLAPPDGAPPGDPPADPPADPGPKAHRLNRRPQNARGVYMVLVGTAADGGTIYYAEVGWYRAHGEEQAKRQAVNDALAGHLPDVKDALAETHGVYLRAVPARSWPKTEKTRYESSPKLVIG